MGYLQFLAVPSAEEINCICIRIKFIGVTDDCHEPIKAFFMSTRPVISKKIKPPVRTLIFHNRTDAFCSVVVPFRCSAFRFTQKVPISLQIPSIRKI